MLGGVIYLYVLGSRKFNNVDNEVKRLCLTGRGGVRGNRKIRILPYLLKELEGFCNANRCGKNDVKILDYGSGIHCLISKELRKCGYICCDSYEIGSNKVESVHINELRRREGMYNCVFANNVLNVQFGEGGVRDMLNEVCCLLAKNSIGNNGGYSGNFYLGNFTNILNNTGMSFKEIIKVMKEYFKEVVILGGNIESKSKSAFLYFKCYL